jgi:hypothetical protein
MCTVHVQEQMRQERLVFLLEAGKQQALEAMKRHKQQQEQQQRWLRAEQLHADRDRVRMLCSKTACACMHACSVCDRAVCAQHGSAAQAGRMGAGGCGGQQDGR